MSKSNQPMPLNLRSLRTRFALHFLRALKKINNNQNQTQHYNQIVANKRCKKIKLAADTSLASAVGPRRAWARAISRRGRHAIRKRGIVRRKVARGVHMRAGGGAVAQFDELRRVVPGGETMDMQKLLDETLHYVMCLTTQVNVMRNIVDLCSSTS